MCDPGTVPPNRGPGPSCCECDTVNETVCVCMKMLGVESQQGLDTSSGQLDRVSANTEESLLTSRTNSQTTSLEEGGRCCKKEPRGSFCRLTTGLLLSTLGILLLIWSPFKILMETRLDMLPGLPPFEWWKDPPQEVRLRAYVFNYTNMNEFLSGEHSKLHVEEIGPIVYLEKLQHKDIQFNDNGTLSYTVNRTAIYLPEENTIDLNSTIIIPNYAILGIASYMSEASFFVKMGFNILLRGMNSQLYKEISLQDFLWNFTDPVLQFGQTMEPERVPDLNIGMLNVIYRDFEDRATVYIGRKNGHSKFFLISRWNGESEIPGHRECSDQVAGSTEGALYPQFISRTDRLSYWRKTLCRVVHLDYERDQYMDKYDVLAYKFTKERHQYDRRSNLSEDCYKGDPVLPSGLFDVSPCYNGIGMAASYPHYLYGSDEIQNYVDGLDPNVSLHESYIYVEPLTGIPIESIARSQSNMVIKDLSGFSPNVKKFSNLALPMFWLEYNQIGLPDYVRYLLVLTVNWVPKYQYYFVCSILALGVYFLVTCNRRKRRRYARNAELSFHHEHELFISKLSQ